LDKIRNIQNIKFSKDILEIQKQNPKIET
jgi:hypothetical protein